ncbi:MAG: arginine--tRNA ligase [Patescibacteria group bacterium]|nr:arginine--tRNA ligase [Patescibacteria group bacterium]
MFDIKTFRETIILNLKKVIEEEFGSSILEDLDFKIELPPQPEMGDLSYPCFLLGRKLKMKPERVAKFLARKINLNEIVERVAANGPYLNFFLQPTKWFQTTLNEILEKKDNFGTSQVGQGKTVMIEFSAPNTNKPQHLGHLRNNFLGASLANLFKNLGYQVIKANLINDRGIHIAKSMLAYQKWGENKTPESEHLKGDHFVGKFYTLFETKVKEKPELLKEAQEILKKWEAGDQEVWQLWQKMNGWAIQGFQETYRKLGIDFDKWYYESEVYKLGKEMVNEALKNNLCYQREDGAIEIDLSNYQLGKKVLIRADGTSIYITQDLGLAKLKYDEYKPDLSLYVVGSEQRHHFKVLFKILEVFGYPWVKNCFHLAYGLVFLPAGKMKSREGIVVEIDELLAEVKKIAKSEILKREKDISPKILEERAEKIALASLKFFFLKFTPEEDIFYEPEKEISFEGATGPYLQYAYARIQSILEKSDWREENLATIDYSFLKEKEEKEILKFLFNFPEVLEKSAFYYNPSFLANYLLQLAQAFNTFYHRYQVLTAEKDIREARLVLIKAVAQVLKNGLSILGIEVLERM